jgi:hypothetical protein
VLDFTEISLRYSRRVHHAVLFGLIVSALSLTRSVYHLIVVVIGFALILLIVPENFKKLVIAGIILLLIPFGWYTKNAVLYDFFGASSWMGFGMWKAASQTYQPEELTLLADAGVISHLAAEVEVLREPSVYADYGFTRVGYVPVVSQNNRHNINMIDIAKEYQHSAIRLIAYDPGRYLRGVFYGYRVFNIPSAEFKHFAPNAQKISKHVWVYSQILEGKILERFSPIHYSSIYFFLIPITILLYSVHLAYATINHKKNLIQFIQQHSVETWMLLLIVYTTLTSIFFEIGENNREKFYIQYLVWIYLVITINRVIPEIFRFIEKWKIKKYRHVSDQSIIRNYGIAAKYT